MKTILLVGEFRHLISIVGNLSGYRMVHCHSLDSLRGEWSKGEVVAIAMSLKELTPTIFDLLQEGQERRPEIKWVLFVQKVSMNLEAYNSDRQIFFQGQVSKDWSPRLKRWMQKASLKHRKAERLPCKGGVRMKDSEFSRKPTGQKVFGTIQNLSSHGAGLIFNETLPYLRGEFIEVAFRDMQGQSRKFHGQIRWISERSGKFWVGLQFLAVAS